MHIVQSCQCECFSCLTASWPWTWSTSPHSCHEFPVSDSPAPPPCLVTWSHSQHCLSSRVSSVTGVPSPVSRTSSLSGMNTVIWLVASVWCSSLIGQVTVGVIVSVSMLRSVSQLTDQVILCSDWLMINNTCLWLVSSCLGSSPSPGSWSRLTHLTVSHGHLTSLSSCLSLTPHLTHLDCSHNKVTQHSGTLIN